MTKQLVASAEASVLAFGLLASLPVAGQGLQPNPLTAQGDSDNQGDATGFRELGPLFERADEDELDGRVFSGVAGEELARIRREIQRARERWLAGETGARWGWLDAGDVLPASQWPSLWRLGEPDLILTMAQPYTLRATGQDVLRQFVVPIPVPATRYVKAWEFRPGSDGIVHHATLQIDSTGASRRLDREDPEPGYEGVVPHSARAPDGYFLNWAPGHTPYVAPDGMAFPVEQNSDLVMMLHLRPSGREEIVRVSVGLYFTDQPPTRTPVVVRLTAQDMDIPAGEKRYAVTRSYALPVDVDVLTVQPHAHYLGRQIEGFAVLPDRSAKWLISNDWDFDRQDVYRYVKPVFLPAGTTLVMRIVFDNSAENPRNPHDPPARVTYGQRSSDEMAELLFQVVLRNETDRAVLTRDLLAKLIPEEIKGYETMLRAGPHNMVHDEATLHDDIALLYANVRNFEQAAAHFTESLRFKPDSASAHYNVGNAWLAQGAPEQARPYFQRAVEIDPAYASAHRGLGIVLQSEGRVDEAVSYYRQAIRLQPDDAVAHYNLGVLRHSQGQFEEAARFYREALRVDSGYADAHYGLAVVSRTQGRPREAVLHYREALRSRPDWPAALLELAWALATSSDPRTRQPGEALRLAERGAQLMGVQTTRGLDVARALDVLAAALAALDRFDEAMATARTALALATAARDEGTARQIGERLQLYRRQLPFREPE
ncbi:MAG: tetratricopeptide repeat protein [Gemmatimonadetes bacterium]|nr:tetratricopeptide repeat protein [Gemmatimonadota bacterium]